MRDLREFGKKKSVCIGIVFFVLLSFKILLICLDFFYFIVLVLGLVRLKIFVIVLDLSIFNVF